MRGALIATPSLVLNPKPKPKTLNLMRGALIAAPTNDDPVVKIPLYTKKTKNSVHIGQRVHHTRLKLTHPHPICICFADADADGVRVSAGECG
jgi:hypothetical protein